MAKRLVDADERLNNAVKEAEQRARDEALQEESRRQTEVICCA